MTRSQLEAGQRIQAELSHYVRIAESMTKNPDEKNKINGLDIPHDFGREILITIENRKAKLQQQFDEL